MNDELLKNYSETEKEYRRVALEESKGYFKSRKKSINLEEVLNIIYPLLKSYEYKIKFLIRKVELSLENEKHDSISRASLNDQIESYNTKLKSLEQALLIDFNKNAIVNGRLAYGPCEEFALEDAETYTLFNEVYNYLEKHTEYSDVDRLEILQRLSNIRSLITITRQNAVQIETEYLNDCLAAIDNEINESNDLTNKDIFALYSYFKHAISNKKHNSDYISELKKRKIENNIKARNLKQLLKKIILKFDIKLYLKIR